MKRKTYNPAPPDFSAYAPYDAAPDFLKKRMPRGTKLPFSFSIADCPSEDYVRLIAHTLESRSAYGITITVIPPLDTDEPERWHISGVSKPMALLSAKEYHEVLGWIYSVASFFNARLSTFAYSMQ